MTDNEVQFLMVFADFRGWWVFGQWGTVGGDYVKSDKTSFGHQFNVRNRNDSKPRELVLSENFRRRLSCTI